MSQYSVKNKILRRAGINFVRSSWYRTEIAHSKWLVRKTLWVVRPNRRRVPVNAVTSSNQITWFRGSNFCRKDRLSNVFRTKLICRNGLRLRFGFRRVRGFGNSHIKGSLGLNGRMGRLPHGRGFEESFAVILIFRSGLVTELGIAREMILRRQILDRSGGAVIGLKSIVVSGTGLRVDPIRWLYLKFVLLSTQSISRKWNGRSGLGYILVDYISGCIILRRRPRFGEVLRPVGIDWNTSFIS